MNHQRQALPWQTWVVVVVLGSFATLRGAEPPPMPRSYEIPYKLTATNHVMVRLKLNGKGPFNFIMDTGAPAIFCATKIARKVGVEPNRDGWGTFDTLEFEGGLKLERVAARIDDPFQLEGMNSLGIAGVELHGMIGYNLLARYRVTYDFTRDKLVLTELPGFEPGEVPSFGGGGQGGLEMIGTMMKFLAPLMNFKGPPERRPRGYLGVELEEKEGVVVTAVYPDSPAEKAGIRIGDRITAIAGRNMSTVAEVLKAMARFSPQDSVDMTLERQGETTTRTVRLGRGL